MRRNRRNYTEVAKGTQRGVKAKLEAPPLPDLITRYLSARERAVAPNTLLALKSKLGTIAAHFVDLRAITPDSIEQFIVSRQAQGLKDASIRNDLNALSSLFRYAIRHGLAVTNPVQGMERPSDREAVRTDVLSPEEEVAYFAACPEGDLRDLARLMLETAARPGELLALTAHDVDLKGSRAYVRQGKTASARRPLILTPEAREIVERRTIKDSLQVQLFPYPSGAKALLVELNRQHRKVLATIGQDWPLYRLRHTALSRLAAHGCPVPTIAAIAGHSSLRMIPRYCHVQESEMAQWVSCPKSTG